METILLMLSGGIDSTYLLYHYLTETNLPVHVHHISLRYPHFRRWIMEDPAVQKIVAYCLEHYRDFGYSESRFDMEPLQLVGSDQALQLLAASKIGPNLPGERVTLALGHCYDDFDTPEAQERVRRRTMPRMWEALIESGTDDGRLNPVIAKPMVDLKLTKKDICRDLPHELLRMCWSCRMPEYIGNVGRPCGRCNTCCKIRNIFRKMEKLEAYPNLVRTRKPGPPRVSLRGSPGINASPPSLNTANSMPGPPVQAGLHPTQGRAVPNSPVHVSGSMMNNGAQYSRQPHRPVGQGDTPFAHAPGVQQRAIQSDSRSAEKKRNNQMNERQAMPSP